MNNRFDNIKAIQVEFMTTENRYQKVIVTDKRGFTLIEVMVAMAIFAVGILALAGLQTNYISGNAQARLKTEATALGGHVIEQLRSMPFDAPDLDPATNPHQPPAGSTGPYDVQWSVTDNTPVNNTKMVTVAVTPVNRNGRPVRLSTIIAE
jgi:prepilin-type N-terminal cleavage/methylation domain-containing protein